MSGSDPNPAWQEANSYLIKGRIGNPDQADGTVVSYALVVIPSQQKVTGQVALSQGKQQLSYSGLVQGSIQSTGFNAVTQIVALKGELQAVQGLFQQSASIPFAAHLALNQEWQGTGGFQFGNLSVEHLPVSHDE